MTVHHHPPTDPVGASSQPVDIPSETSPLPPLAAWGAQCAVVAPVVAVIAIVIGAPVYTTPMAAAALTDRLLVANAATLVVLLLLVVVAVGLLVRGAHLLGAVGQASGLLALVGTVLAAGGAWDSLFALPYVAAGAPELLSAPTGGTLLAGFLVSYAVFAAGWLSVALACGRALLVSRTAAVLVCIASMLALVPAPTALRLLPLTLALAWVVGRSPRRAAGRVS